MIARHPRSYEREDFVFEPLHYLALIEQKINALDQAAPLAGWQLPEEFMTTNPLRRSTASLRPAPQRRQHRPAQASAPSEPVAENHPTFSTARYVANVRSQMAAARKRAM